jgi:uncharacterized membrane protein YfcA
MASNPVFLIVFGVVVGVFSGVMGLGGGSIMIPVMVLALAMDQPTAHGTSLAVMIPPVTLPAVIEYYRKGCVDLRVAGWMAIGVLMGTFFGAWIATSIPKETLKIIFGFVLIYTASYTVLGKAHLVRTMTLSAALVLVAMAVYMVVRWYDTAGHAAAAAAAG